MTDADKVALLLDYNPDTGDFIWKERDYYWFKQTGRCDWFNAKRAGKSAVSVYPDSKGLLYGHITFRLLGEGWRTAKKAHRIAHLLMTGEWPEDKMDHINGDTLDNRWSNLRSTDNAGNNRNRRFSGGRSGVVGVSEVHLSDRSVWRARLKVSGVEVFSQQFDTLEEAAVARKEAELLHGYHPNHGAKARTDDNS